MLATCSIENYPEVSYYHDNAIMKIFTIMIMTFHDNRLFTIIAQHNFLLKLWTFLPKLCQEGGSSEPPPPSYGPGHRQTKIQNLEILLKFNIQLSGNVFSTECDFICTKTTP